jgi:hypothetical protein
MIWGICSDSHIGFAGSYSATVGKEYTKMKNAISPKVFAVVVVLLAVVFGVQPAIGASAEKVSGEERVFRISDDLKPEDVDKLELEGFEDQKGFEDEQINDDDLLSMVLLMKVLGDDMKRVFKDERNFARMFDQDINHDILSRDDLKKSLGMLERLLAEADKNFIFEDDDNSGSGSGDEDRVRLIGTIQSMPEGLLGDFVIGGQTFSATPETEFDELDGPLTVGGCAKVDLRNGMVHEIDSEPVGDCR